MYNRLINYYNDVKTEKKVFVITFDALGTLVEPKNISENYQKIAFEVLNKNGYSNYYNKENNSSTKQLNHDFEIFPNFCKAFKELNSKYPIYGKYNSSKLLSLFTKSDTIDSSKFKYIYDYWWYFLIKKTIEYSNLKIPNKLLLNEIIYKLLNFYSNSYSYHLLPNTIYVFNTLLKEFNLKNNGKNKNILYLGILSNSDPRINKVLNEFGLSKYFGINPDQLSLSNNENSLRKYPNVLNGIFLSYDYGLSKPDLSFFHQVKKEIFETFENDIYGFDFWHVGNDFKKDTIAALNSDWNSVLVHNKPPHNFESECFENKLIIANDLIDFKNKIINFF